MPAKDLFVVWLSGNVGLKPGRGRAKLREAAQQCVQGGGPAGGGWRGRA